MAWSAVGQLGADQNKVASTTIVMTATATAVVGSVVFVYSAWNNAGTSNADTSQLSLADSAGNTWTKIAERTTSAGAANDGVTIAVWVTRVTTQITNASSTMTVTSTSSRAAKMAGAYNFSIDGNAITGAPSFSTLSDNAADPSDITLGSMANQEHLMIWCLGNEGPSTDAYTQDSDYTNMVSTGTTGSTADTNIQGIMRRRFFTGTTDTVVTASTTADRDYAQILCVVNERNNLTAGGLGAIVPLAVLFPPTLKYVVVTGTISTTVLSAPTVKYSVVGGTISTTALSAPTVTPGAVAVTNGFRASALTVNAPTVQYVVLGGTVASGNVLFAPTLRYKVSLPTISGTLLFAPAASYAATAATISSTLLFAPSVSQGGATQNVTGGTISGTALSAPTLAYVVLGGTKASGVSLGAPTLAYQINGSTISAEQTFAPTVSAGAVTVVNGFRASGVTFGPPTTAYRILGPTLSTTQTFSPTVRYLILGPTIASGNALFAPSVRQIVVAASISSTVLSPPTVTNSGAISGGTVSSTLLFAPSAAYRVLAGTRASALVLGAPSVSYVVLAGTRASAVQAFAPSVAYRVAGQTVAGTALFPPTVATEGAVSTGHVSTTLLFAPSVFAQTAILGATIAPGTTLGPPTTRYVVLGPTRASAVQAFAPALSYKVSLPAISGTALFGPTVLADQAVSLGTISTTAVLAPAVAYGLSLGTISSGSTLGSPSVTVGAVTIFLPLLSETVLFGPGVMTQWLYGQVVKFLALEGSTAQLGLETGTSGFDLEAGTSGPGGLEEV